jgi:hypothetical protein
MALAISTPRVHAFELRTPMPKPAPTVSPLIQWIDTFRQHDLVLISLVTCIIVFMIIIETAARRALARRSLLYI